MGARTPGPDDEQDPTSDADDVDARFAEITASLGDLTVPPADAEERRSEGPADPAPPDAAPPPEPGPRDYVVQDDDEDGYTPPEPEPLSTGDPVVAIGWVAVLAPLVLVLVYLMLWRGMPAALLGLAGVAFVLGVGVLVWRMPSRRSPEDDDDNGAVV